MLNAFIDVHTIAYTDSGFRWGKPQQQQFGVSAEVDKMSKAMKEVKEADIQVVPEEFLDKAKDSSTVAELIKSLNLASWGGDVSCPSCTLAVPVYRRFFFFKSETE